MGDSLATYIGEILERLERMEERQKNHSALLGVMLILQLIALGLLIALVF